ncbi:MAG: hypothetical protein O3A51_06780 [Verrucomicrobia bacterium]|nr:hypothetical protein [Verrucomicrobiota bacterium]
MCKRDRNTDPYKPAIVQRTVAAMVLIHLVVLPTLAADVRHAKVGNEIFLENDYISIGISGSGSYGTAGSAPIGFHPVGPRTTLGLSADYDGFDQGAGPTAGDWFLPGSPEESFTAGYRTGSAAGPTAHFSNAERSSTVQIIRDSTEDLSQADTIQARWIGTTTSGNLKVTQVVQAHAEHEFFLTTIKLENVGAIPLYAVRYMRSFDPDQDSDFHGNFQTVNSISDQFPGDTRAVVLASGPVTGAPILLATFDPRGRVSNFGFSNRDPYTALAYDAPRPKGWSDTSDTAITIAFDVGNLAVGESETVRFVTSINDDISAALTYIESLENAPTDILLSNDSIADHKPGGTAIGNLSAVDDVGDLHIFELVSGVGDTDNSDFTIVGNELRSTVVFAYDPGYVFSIRVQATDSHGNTFEKVVAVTLLASPTLFSWF